MAFLIFGYIGYLAVTVIFAGVLHILFVLFYSLRHRFKIERQLLNIPRVPGHWLLGNVLQFGKPNNILSKGREFTAKYGPARLVRIGLFKPVVVLAGAEYIKPVLTTATPKNTFIVKFLHGWIGDGLLLSSGKKWSRNRRLLTPAFHFDILKPYVDIFSSCTKVTIAKWKEILRKRSSVEMFESISLLTLDSLLKCIFGYDSNCQLDGANTPYIKAIYELTELVSTRGLDPLLHPDIMFYLSSTGRKFRKATKIVHKYSSDIIKSRRNNFKVREKLLKEERYASNDTDKKILIDFLDILLGAKDELGDGLTDTEIQHEVDTFMFEGHDTTASGLSWFLYNMARHPEYQQKCRNEINSILESNDISWDDLVKFEYLTMCIKESLRLHNPVPLITRTLTHSVKLPNNITLPPECWVTISLDSLHHNPDFWPNPDLYDPSRFASENIKDRPSHAFLAFSAGPRKESANVGLLSMNIGLCHYLVRNCIGQNFAMNEMKTVAALLLKNFEFSVDESVPVIPWSEIILRTKDGIWLKLKPLST